MKNVLEWLEATADRLPDKLAVADPDSELSFAELLDRARRAGTWLATEGGVRPREAVALYLEKSPAALAAMYGTVYAGGFYSAIDTRHPAPRVQAICEALDPSVILTDDAYAAQAAEIFADTPWRDRIVRLDEALADEPDDALLARIRAQAQDVDPLYVTFTSGSTGTPKGVVASQRGVLDFVPAFDAAVGICEDDVHGNQAPFDFDASVKDIYSSMRVGSTVRIIPRAYFTNPTRLMDYLCECEVTTLVWAVGAMSFVSVMGGFDYRVPTTIRRVLFSGEVMPPKQLRIWQNHLPDALYVNLYGPTETTCNCTYFKVDRIYGDDEAIPIGHPFDDERIILLDEQDREVSEPGVQGEICVSGTTLALGYLGSAERTAKAFMQNPANSRWLETIYRTGDLGYYAEDGNLMYVSRKDNQIKHLGQRIELGDIENAALHVDGVRQACCVYDHRRQKLRLFYVGDVAKDDVVAHLKEVLPSFMVPNTTRQLDQMPLTSSGKVDRKGLADLRARRRRARHKEA